MSKHTLALTDRRLTKDTLEKTFLFADSNKGIILATWKNSRKELQTDYRLFELTEDGAQTFTVFGGTSGVLLKAPCARLSASALETQSADALPLLTKLVEDGKITVDSPV